jgi:vacuolar-type H+-ATPase subunit C/Vma6
MMNDTERRSGNAATQHFYACGRVGVLKRTALKPSQLDRLLSAPDYQDALRTLSDIGFAAADTTDFQAAADGTC